MEIADNVLRPWAERRPGVPGAAADYRGCARNIYNSAVQIAAVSP